MNVPFERICAELSLGALTVPPVRLNGGYTHRMFRLTTDRGDYAVKLLNPEIMQRPDAPGNFRRAERYEALLERAGLPILPAKTIVGRKMHCVAGQNLYVFDCFDGRPLRDEEITPAHCAKMGAVLAQIHRAGPTCPQTAVGAGIARPLQEAPDSALSGSAFWNGLADALLSSGDGKAAGEVLRAAVPMLTRAAAAMEAAVRRLPRVRALCHNDMDAKNVLWQGEDFRIIDLECLDLADPLQEMLDLAVSWAGWALDEGKFKAFVSAYYEAGGLRPTDAALLYDSRRNHIDWLVYNARRALFDDPAERRTGREQIAETLEKIESDQRNRATILRWMGEI